MDTRRGPVDLNRLRWRCRRGLLENDLFIERLFEVHGEHLTPAQGDALMALMELADNDLLDLFLRRTEPQGELATPAIEDLLALVRRPAAEVH